MARAVVKYSTTLWFILLLSGCGYRFASKFFDKHEDKALQYYDSRFPATQYFIPGTWSYDTVVEYVPKRIDVDVIGPHRVDTIVKNNYIRSVRVDTIRFTDTKALANARNKIKDLTDKNIVLKGENALKTNIIEHQQKSIKTWSWLAICSMLIIVCFGAGWAIGKFKLL